MPAQTVDALFRSLNKGDLAPVYYFYGPEDVLKDEAVRTILDKAIDPTLRDFNFDQRSASQLDVEDIDPLCNTLPMMAERRVVLVRDVEAWKRKTKARGQFLKYLDRPSGDAVVILMQGSVEEAEDKELAARAYAVRFDPLPAERARKWLLLHAGKLGVTLEHEAAEHLVRAVGPDLGALQSELSKLASLPAGEPVTAKIVGELVGVAQGETMWDWREAVLDGETGKALTLLPSILAQSGISGVRLVTAVGTALVGLGIARAHYDQGTRGRALEGAVMKSLLNIRPFGLLSYKEEASRWSRWAPNWPMTRIRSALRVARDTDEALKNTTVSDEQGLMTDLVLRLARWTDGDRGAGQSGSGRGSGSQRIVHMATTAMLLLMTVCGLSVLSTAANAQTEPRLIEAVREAQEGRGDSARTKVRLLLAATSPTDTLYPQIIYTQAMVASDANEMRRQLQRVAVEYPSSSWADDALLRLVQLDYGSGNLEGAARNLERIRLDYPGSSLLPQASYWAARTYFDQKAPETACRWIADGLPQARNNVELRNQLSYLDQRCAGVRAELAAKARADSQASIAAGGTDSGALPARTDSTAVASPLPSTSPEPTPTPATTRVDTAAAAATTTTPPQSVPAPSTTAPAGRFRVQITAVRAQSTAEALARKLRSQGLAPTIYQEGGLYKVRVGNYATRPEAAAAVPELKGKLGGSPFVVAEP